MVSFKAKKTAAEKAYVLALCKTLVLLNLKSSEQNVIRLIKNLLSRVADSAYSEKDLLKEVKLVLEHLKSLDDNPSEELSQDEAQDEAKSIFGTLIFCFCTLYFDFTICTGSTKKLTKFG